MRPITEDERFQLYLKELSNESDRGAVIIGAAYIDGALSDLIRAYLHLSDSQYQELLDGKFAPLGTFSSRILASHLLGLIDDNDASSINIIRRTRNDFAHELESSFDEPPISDRCDSLRGKYSLYLTKASSRREIFQSTTAYIIGSLQVKIDVIREFNISGKYIDVFRLHGKD